MTTQPGPDTASSASSMTPPVRNLLLELFVEELPPKALKKIDRAFAEAFQAALQAQGLLSADSVLTHYASPRRLAVHLTAVLPRAADKQVAQKLMPVSVGLNTEGEATPALQKRLAALGAVDTPVSALTRAIDGKAEALFLHSTVQGATLTAGVQQALETALDKLPIPKMMSYQLADGWETVHFVRPAHGLVVLHGNDVLPVTILGLEAGRSTHGHRFEAAADPIVLQQADDYASQLAKEGAVIASFAERRAEIERQLSAAAVQAGSGLHPIADADLLDEVTGLVERPNVLIGEFEEAFLDVPQECLVLTMKVNQKYFPLLNAAGKLSNRFLIVSNVTPADPGAVIGGNERVIRPRLADAQFFFEQDRKKPLAERINELDKVVYHNRLGTQGARSRRVAAIAAAIGQALEGEALARQAGQAAQLAKTDLSTDMVGEFPELQGTMGRYYALHEGLPGEIADAIEDHYKPRFSGDTLPRNAVGVAVALADKLETLTGLFGIGQLPTGDKDPFALRRHALGVIRMLVEKKLDLRLDQLLSLAWEVMRTIETGGISKKTASTAETGTVHVSAAANVGFVLVPETPARLQEFLFERFAISLREQGYRAQEVDAVLALQPQRLADVSDRLAAVRSFAALPEAASLAAANKRVSNILKKADGQATFSVDPGLLSEPAEAALHQALMKVGPVADHAFEQGEYAASLQALAMLKDPVDAFFDQVMVNADDPALRANRLGLLASLHTAMNRVADLSRLAA